MASIADPSIDYRVNPIQDDHHRKAILANTEIATTLSILKIVSEKLVWW